MHRLKINKNNINKKFEIYSIEEESETELYIEDVNDGIFRYILTLIYKLFSDCIK